MVFDDCYSNFNTQVSTQWDGLRHFAHLSSGHFYNGVKPSEVARGTEDSNSRLGIHHMARKGIAGRAVLLDYARWAAKHNPNYDAFKRTEITVKELDQVAEWQGVQFEQGDILMIRTGWIHNFTMYGDKVVEHLDDPHEPSCAGLQACEETFKWTWNHHFSAVCSDNFSFEAHPIKDWTTSCRKRIYYTLYFFYSC